MNPNVTASPTTKANYSGLFVINTIPETYYNHGPMFCATNPQVIYRIIRTSLLNLFNVGGRTLDAAH